MTLFEDHQASNSNSSCKRNKLELIDDYLLSTGFKRNPICKDGSCLFRAVAEQLFKTQKYHVSVREACVRYMKRHQHLFENFVDNSFDDYLHKMMNPKEWADQLEISALSKMYSCDFYIYDQPGHEAKNVTDNGYSKHVYLCQSGQRHYDSVFPITKFESFGFCQALIYDMLLLRVFGTTATERNKIMTTFRMLNCKESDDNVEEFYPSERIYEPSIGLTTEGVSLCRQNGLGYNLPVSLAFIRSLDPTVYRNVEYDLWVEIKRKQQFLDNSYAVGMNYFIGDRCLVSLSIFSKPLVGHVQEVTPNNGPITCFIEALGEMHTTAVRNIKPLDSPNNNSVRSSDGGGSWSSSSRSRRKSSSDTFWGGAGGHNSNSSRNSGSGRRNNSYKSKFGFSEMSSSLPNVDNHNFGGRFNNNELSKRRNNNGSTSSNVGRQTQRSDYFNKKNSDHATPPRRLNKGERKNHWNNNRQQRAASTSNYSPSYSNHGTNNNLPPHNYQDSPEWHEDTFDECGGTSYSGADGKWASSQDGGFVTDGGGSDQVFHSPTKDVNNNIPDSNDGGVVYQWNNYSNSPGNDDSSIIESRSTSQMNASVVDSPMSLGYGQVQLMSPAAAGGDNEEHYQQNVTNNNSTTTATTEGEMQASPQSATNDGDVDNSNQTEQLDNIDAQHDTTTTTTTPISSTQPLPLSTTPTATHYCGPSCFPSSNLTMVDAEGKEVMVSSQSGDKSPATPIQYFYNLGVEYYRMMTQPGMAAPTAAPIPIGAQGGGAPTMYVQPQQQQGTTAYLPTTAPSAGYIVPYPVQQQSHGSSGCVPTHHFHSAPPAGSFVIQPNSSSAPLQYPSSNRAYYVQMPPQTAIVPHHQQYTTAGNTPADNKLCSDGTTTAVVGNQDTGAMTTTATTYHPTSGSNPVPLDGGQACHPTTYYHAPPPPHYSTYPATQYYPPAIATTYSGPQTPQSYTPQPYSGASQDPAPLNLNHLPVASRA